MDRLGTVRYDGLSSADLAAAMQAPSCLVLPTVTSALDVIHELASEGGPAGTVVLADEQVSGRGREGRRWHSLPGAGVLLAYLHRPGVDLVAGVLALRVGLAVREALHALGFDARLKWPNDVMLHDRKAGGILCEARSAAPASWIAVGIGLNVHGPLPDDVAGGAIALDQVRPGVTRPAVLRELVPRLHRLSHAPALGDAEQRAYQAYDWLAGRHVTEPVAGRVSGIDADGALVVDTEAGRQRVLAGTVVAA